MSSPPADPGKGSDDLAWLADKLREVPAPPPKRDAPWQASLAVVDRSEAGPAPEVPPQASSGPSAQPTEPGVVAESHAGLTSPEDPPLVPVAQDPNQPAELREFRRR